MRNRQRVRICGKAAPSWVLGRRWFDAGHKVGHAIQYASKTSRCCQGQPISRRDRPSGQWDTRGKAAVQTAPIPSLSHHPTDWQRTGTLSEKAVGSSAFQTVTSLPHLQSRHAAMPPCRHAALAGLAGWSGRMAAKVSAAVSPRSHPPDQNSRSPMLMFVLILALALALVPSLSRHPRHVHTHAHDKPACRNIRTASTTLCRILSAIFRLTLQDAAHSEPRWASATAPPSSGRLLQPFRPI